mmetsp:Transcript_17155/g.51323  ORF Transcript_17155/g.51323 Transcript_17155/m.51323 type:complete len:100 (-) Transcript_17155:2044-2343(-)
MCADSGHTNANEDASCPCEQPAAAPAARRPAGRLTVAEGRGSGAKGAALRSEWQFLPAAAATTGASVPNIKECLSVLVCSSASKKHGAESGSSLSSKRM